jgi:molybdopterin converting factor small subunit
MIKIKVVFKSFLKMKTGLSEWEQTLPEGSSVYDLAIVLGKLYGKEVADYLVDPSTRAVSVLFSCNKKMCTKDHIVQNGDVISIFPALAGG